METFVGLSEVFGIFTEFSENFWNFFKIFQNFFLFAKSLITDLLERKIGLSEYIMTYQLIYGNFFLDFFRNFLKNFWNLFGIFLQSKNFPKSQNFIPKPWFRLSAKYSPLNRGQMMPNKNARLYQT